MRMVETAIALTLCATLTACETVRTVNGVEIHPAQEQSSFCGRNLALCIGGGALAVGGIAIAASSGYKHKSYSTTGTGGATGATGGMYP